MSPELESALLENLQRQTAYMEQMVHGGGTGLGKTNLRDTRGIDVKQIETLIKNVKLSGQQFGLFNKVLKNNQTIATQVSDSLQEMDDELKTLTEGVRDTAAVEKEAILTTKRKQLAEAAAAATIAQTNEKLRESIGRSGTILAAGIGKVVSGLSGGSSAFELSSGIMSTGLDLIGETSKATGNAVGATGTIMANSTNPKVKALGAIASVAGPLLGELGDAASKAAKFGIDILTKEVEKTIKSFHDATGAGALFANGMDDVRKYAGTAGLTVEMFSNVIKNNAGSMADAGYTVADGAKIVANVTGNLATQTGKSGNSLQRELQNLGYGFEEQGNLVAEMTANLRRSGGTATNGQVAQATAEMGKNMRIVADIMGEDAKAKKDAAKKQSEAYAFDAKLRQRAKETGDIGLIDRTRVALSLMPDAMRRAAIQSSVLGGAVTDASANILGMADGGREFSQTLFGSVNPSLEELNRGAAKYGDTMINGINETGRAVSVASIATGALANVSADMEDANKVGFKNNSENAAKAVAAADAAMNAQGELHKSVMAAEKEVLNFKVDMQELMIGPMRDYAKFTAQMLASMRKMVEAATGEIMNKDKGESWTEKAGRYGSKMMERGFEGGAAGTLAGGVIGGVAGAIGGAGVGAVPGAMAGSATGRGIGTVVGAIEGLGEELIHDIFSDKNVAKKAAGGFTEPGKLNIAGEAGMEAVVPLPDGNTIPVKLNISDMMNGPSTDDTGKTSKDIQFLAAMQAEAIRNATDVTGLAASMITKLADGNASQQADTNTKIAASYEQIMNVAKMQNSIVSHTAHHRGPAQAKKSESLLDGLGKFLSNTNPLFKAVDSIATLGENVMADPRSLGEQASAGFDSMATGMTDMMDWASSLPQKLAQTTAEIVMPQQEAAQQFDPTELINQITKQNADSLSSMTTTLTELINTAKDQLEKQDEMLRAMNDTKDATERLYGAMA